MAQAIQSNMLIRNVLQCGGEVGDEVVDVFDTDAQAEHVRINSCRNLLLRAELGVSCGCRMYDEGLGISYAAHMEDEFKTGHEGCSCLETSLHAECEHTAETMLEILLSKLMILVALKTRVVHALDCRMLLKELGYCKGIVTATLGSQRQSLKTLEHEE